MNKIKLSAAILLLGGTSYGQCVSSYEDELLAMNYFEQDTLAHSVSGKEKFEFDYYTSKVLNFKTTENFEDFKLEINKNEIVYLDLFDKLASDTSFSRQREISVYLRTGEIESFLTNSKDATFEFDGNEVKKVVIHKPNK